MWRDHDSLCLQVAELDAYAGQIRVDADSLRESLNEVEVSQGMLSDTVDSVHYGLVQLGGYANHSDLTAEGRRQMFAQERGNLVASRTMGSGRYLQVVRHSTRGVATAGEDTDEHMEEQPESEDEMQEDPTVDGDINNTPYGNLIAGLRDEINAALRREHFRDAAEFQNVVLYVLDNMNAGNLAENSGCRTNVIREVCTRIESFVPRYERLVPQVAVRLRILAHNSLQTPEYEVKIQRERQMR